MDIQNREHIDKVVRLFYDKLLSNELMKPIFLDAVKIDFEEHFGILVDFWDNILFYTGAYQRNAMMPHLDLHKVFPLKKVHFDTWLTLFEDSINELYEGEKANQAIERARSIGTIMQMKLHQMDKD